MLTVYVRSAIWLVQPVACDSRILHKNGIHTSEDSSLSGGGGAGNLDLAVAWMTADILRSIEYLWWQQHYT